MAAGIRFTRVGVSGISGDTFFAAAKNLQNVIAEELEDAGAEGLLEAQQIVESSGTGNTWSGPFRDRDGTIRTGPGPGRINTGKMLKALDYRVYKGQGVGIDVGWIHVWEAYFGAQDEGTSAGGYRRGDIRHIEGMGVISHMRNYMRGKVDEALDRALERTFDAL